MMLESNVLGENSFDFIHTMLIGNDLLQIRKMNMAGLTLKNCIFVRSTLAPSWKQDLPERSLPPAFLCAHIFIERETSAYEAESSLFQGSQAYFEDF